jgi:hypothetical protein
MMPQRLGWTRSISPRCFSKRRSACYVTSSKDAAAPTGPELTYEGDRNPELLNFAHAAGEHTMFNWNVQHLIKASGFAEHADA